MMNRKYLLLLILISAFFQSCFDLSENKLHIYKNYYISDDPGNGLKTLYFEFEDGNYIERVTNIKKAGHVKKFIIAENNEGFYFINTETDNKFLNATEIVGKPKTHEDLKILLDSMQVKNFKFDYN